MKVLLFWLLVFLNLGAFAISLMRFTADQSYQAAVVAVTLLANVVGVFYTKPHWKAPLAGTVVTQTKNVAGGDIAAGNITKGREPSIGA